jgi:hypothetical protein
MDIYRRVFTHVLVISFEELSANNAIMVILVFVLL